jgi:hypothetical protein
MMITDADWGTGSDGDGVVTLCVPQGATHLRLGSSQAARLSVSFGRGDNTVNLTFENRVDLAIPSGQNGKAIIRRRSGGTVPIGATWLVS